MEKAMNRYRYRLIAMGAAIVALLPAGCTVGPKYQKPAATVQPAPLAYKELPNQSQDSGDWKVAQPQDAMLRGKWWEIYNDPELNSLEEQLNINNQNIKQAY
jgi:outer membrane protein TolC